MPSRREQYFKNYVLEQVPDKSKKGYKNVYKYIGDYYSWNVTDKCLRNQKLLLTACEIASIVFFFAASTRPVKLNRNLLVILPAMLSLCCWLFEILSMGTFCLVKQPMKEDDYQKIIRTLPASSLLRACFLAVAALASTVISFTEKAGAMGILTAFCYMISCLFPLVIRQLFSKFSKESGVIPGTSHIQK